MFFRALILILLSQSLLSCNWWKEDDRPQKKKITVDVRYSCLKDIGDRIDQYIRGDLSADKAKDFVGCLEKALVEYLRYIEGSSRDSFTPGEIRYFLEKYFIDPETKETQRKISDPLQESVMDFKKAILGGSAYEVTRIEIKQLIDLLSTFKSFVVELQPFIKVIANKSVNEDQVKLSQDLTSGIGILHKYKVKLISKMNFSKSGFQFYDLKKMVINLKNFKSPNKILNEEKLRYQFLFFNKYKQLIVAGEIDSIESNKWSELVTSSIDLYESYLKYHYFIKNNDIFYGKSLQSGKDIFESVYAVLTKAFIIKENKQISFDELKDFIKSYLRMGNKLPFNFSLSNSFSFLKKLIKRSYSEEQNKRPEDRRLTGLNKSVLIKIKKDFDHWFLAQEIIDHRKFPIENSRYKPDKKALQLVEQLGELHPLYLFDNKMNLKIDEVYIRNSSYGKGSVYNESDNLSIFNLYNALGRFIFKSYSRNLSVRNRYSGLSGTELQKFYEDFREVGVESELINPNNFKAGKRAFLEGNLFLFSSDGIKSKKVRCSADDYCVGSNNYKVSIDESRMSLSEFVELTALSFSGSMKGKRIFEFTKNICPVDTNYLGVFGMPTITKKCFIENSQTILFLYFMNLKGFSDYIYGLKSAQLENLVDYLFDIISEKEGPRDRIELTELVTLSAVLQYVEALMINHDRDANGLLNYTEMLTIFDKFDGYLHSAIFKLEGSVKGKWTREQIFFYLINHGKKPSGIDMLRILSKELFVVESESKNIELDYFGLIKAIGYVGKLTSVVDVVEEKIKEIDEKKFDDKVKIKELKKIRAESEK